MDNNEDYLDALTAYARNPSREIPPILEQYLNGVAKNGETLFQWPLLKPLIVGKMEQVITELRQGLGSEHIPTRPNVENVRFDVMHARIMDALHKFNGAPFTIQRLCELLIDPKRHYKRSDKFMRGLEKNVLVVSTVDPYGRKVVSESSNKHLVNGMDTNGSPFFPRDSNISTNLPPVPGWVTTTVALSSTPKNTPPADTTEKKPTQQQASRDSPNTATGSPSDPASSLYSDQVEQPPAVHAEEVVEETVVTMDTNEASSVATDGGESMAEEDDEEEEMAGDDTNASSSSSSSSSSEELSASDTCELQAAATPQTTIETSTSETDKTRPWASIASEGENNKDHASASDDLFPSTTTDSVQNSEHLRQNKQTESTLSLEANSSDYVVNSAEPTSKSPSQIPSEPELALNSSYGFEPSIPAMAENMDVSKDVSESDVSNNMTTSDIESEYSTSSDDFTSTSVDTNSTIVSPEHSQPNEPSLGNMCSYAEVLASSNNSSPKSPVPAGECESVARLVDSVEPPPPQVSLSSSSPPVSDSSTAGRHTEFSHQLPSSNSYEESEEPKAKYPRLSEEQSFYPSPSAVEATDVLASSDNVPPSPNSSPTKSHATPNTEPDSATNIPLSSAINQSTENKEFLNVVPCSADNTNLDTAAMVEQGIGDGTQKDVSSPPSESSPDDSQGFDVCGETSDKINTEEKSEEHVKEEMPPQETEAKAILETDKEQEPMDQE